MPALCAALQISVPFNERKFVNCTSSKFCYPVGVIFKEYLGVASAAVEAEGIGVNKSCIRDIRSYVSCVMSWLRGNFFLFYEFYWRT